MPRSFKKISVLVRTEFNVYDSSDVAVTGLVDGNFTKLLSLAGVNDATAVTVTEIANGRYTATFTPASLGVWVLRITNATYNKRGWEEEFDVTTSGFDDLALAAALATVQADTDNIQTRLPAALVGGRMDSNVAVIQADVVNSSALSADAAAKIRDAIEAGADINQIIDDLATIMADTNNMQTRLPTALVGGRMDASVGAVAANAITASAVADAAFDAASFASDMSVYTAKLVLLDDDTGTTDHYIVTWFKNGAPITSGITVPTIQVVKAADGSDLIASTAMTQVAATGAYRYDATTTARVTDGVLYFAVAGATIDAGARVWRQPVGRDS